MTYMSADKNVKISYSDGKKKIMGITKGGTRTRTQDQYNGYKIHEPINSYRKNNRTLVDLEK